MVTKTKVKLISVSLLVLRSQFITMIKKHAFVSIHSHIKMINVSVTIMDFILRKSTIVYNRAQLNHPTKLILKHACAKNRSFIVSNMTGASARIPNFILKVKTGA